MSAIIKGFPNIHLSNFPSIGLSPFYTEIPGTLSSLPSKEDQLLDLVVGRLLKEKDQWDSENTDEKRTLQNINKIATSKEIKKGNCLMSLFAYYHSKIGKEIKTDINYDIDEPEYADAPENTDYNLDYLSETGDVNYDDEKYHIITEGVPGRMVFSVEHKNKKDNPTIPCSHCHQSGLVKCPECNGTGRVQYEDGNYSAGNSRMRTTACPECGGKGKIPCPECNGTGQIEVYAANYAVIKSVKEISSVRVNAQYSVPWEKSNHVFSTPYELEKMEYGRGLEGMADFTTLRNGEDVLKLLNKKGEVTFLKKNRKEFIEDNQKAILDEVSDLGLEELYKYNEEHSKADLSEAEKIRGSVICRKELHFVFPVITLSVHYGEWDVIDFFFYENNGKVEACALDVGPTYSGDLFKMKLKSLFKK